MRTCVAELDRRLPDLFRTAAAKEGLTALARGDSRHLRRKQTLKFAPPKTAVNILYRDPKQIPAKHTPRNPIQQFYIIQLQSNIPRGLSDSSTKIPMEMLKDCHWQLSRCLAKSLLKSQ